MTPAGTIFHRLAAKDYLGARRWYARHSEKAANSFELEMESTLRRIAARPQSGTPYGQRFRWMKLRRFAYVVFYELMADRQIRVLAVSHGRRRPGYWLWRAKRP